MYQVQKGLCSTVGSGDKDSCLVTYGYDWMFIDEFMRYVKVLNYCFYNLFFSCLSLK